MIRIAGYIKSPYQKIAYIFTLTLVLYIACTGLFSIPLNSTTMNISARAGGLSFYAIGALFLLTVIKAAFLEFVKNSSIRSSGQTVFRFLHKALGWIILILASYHSLFFLYYYIWPVVPISIFVVITGLCAMACLFYVVILGRNTFFKNSNYESMYFKHVFATLLLILITVIHLNLL